MSDAPKKTCAHCGKPATLQCSRCKSQNYCDAACQKTHWKKHKKTCNLGNLDTAVRRAGRLIQSLYILLREHCAVEKLASIEDTGTRLILHHGEPEWGAIYPLPKHLVKSEEEKKMVLCASRCTEVVAYMHDLLVQMLKEHKIVIAEALLEIPSPKRRTLLEVAGTILTPDGPKIQHSVFQITSPQTKRQWILDTSGPQLCIFEPCMDIATYLSKYKSRVHAVVPGGHEKLLYQMLAKRHGLAGILIQVQWDGIGVIERGIAEWKAESGCTLQGLLGKEGEEFEVLERKLLDGVEAALRKFVEAADYQKGLRNMSNEEILRGF